MFITRDDQRIHQGDILKDITYTERVYVEEGKVKEDRRILPYVVVLTQDCDLEWDYNNHNSSLDNHDKYLQSILLCLGYIANSLREGVHLGEIGLRMQRLNYRYHFLEGNKELSIPDLVFDFKHYYAILRDILYENVEEHYMATLNTLFRENLSHRFTHYLSRIGLPEIKKDIEEEAK